MAGAMVTEGIKVVDEAPGVAAAAIRTVLRLVDGLLGYAVAFVVAGIGQAATARRHGRAHPRASE